MLCMTEINEDRMRMERLCQDLSDPEPIEIDYLMMDYVSSAEKKGYAGNYVSFTFKALKSWLAHDNRDLKIKVKISSKEGF